MEGKSAKTNLFIGKLPESGIQTKRVPITICIFMNAIRKDCNYQLLLTLAEQTFTSKIWTCHKPEEV